MRVLDSQQVKLAASPYLQKYLTGQLAGPPAVELSVSGVCHEGCSYCLYRGRHSGVVMSSAAFSRMIYGMQTVRAITITGGGEPTENPELLNISAEINMYQKRLGLFTNMEHPERIQPKHYDWIRVSVTTKSLDKSGYDWISSCPKVGFCVNYSGMKDAHLVEKAIELLEKHDFSYIHVRPLLGRDGASLPVDLSGIPKHDKVIVKIEKATDIIAGERLYGDCVGHNFVPFIWEDGSVYTCAYHRGNPTYLLGNAITGNFGAIMTTAAKTYPVIPSCMVCCKNHDANTLIHLCNLVENPEFI